MASPAFADDGEASGNLVRDGGFDYPDRAVLASTSSVPFDWFIVDPLGGSWFHYTDTADLWLAIPGWDADRFGWRSTQVAGSAMGQHAGAVEMQVDEGSGNQYAEMVASQQGASLFQDLSTPPGSILRWSLRHASIASSYVDRMSVLIGEPGSETAQEAERVTVNGSGDVMGPVGTVISTRTANIGDRDHEGQWETYQGTYEVPAGQQTTRVMFNSIASRDGVSGNLLDDVTFTPLYPLYYDANVPEGATLTGSVPATGLDADGVWRNYHALSETPELVDAASTDLALTGPDGRAYRLLGWSREPHAPIDLTVEPAPTDLITTYEGLVASGSDTRENMVHAVWGTSDAPNPAPAHNPLVRIDSSVDSSVVRPGDTLTYTFTVTNLGDATARGIYVKDLVPEGTTFVSCEGSGARYGATVAGAEFATWWIPTLEPGGCVELRLTVRIDVCGAGGSLEVSPSIGSGYESRPPQSTDPVNSPSGSGGGMEEGAFVGTLASVTIAADPSIHPGWGPGSSRRSAAVLPWTGDKLRPMLLVSAGLLVVGLVVVCVGIRRSRQRPSHRSADRSDSRRPSHRPVDRSDFGRPSHRGR